MTRFISFFLVKKYNNSTLFILQVLKFRTNDFSSEIWYNEANELDAMLSFLSANSYEEMERIACGKKEALAIMDELKRLAKEENFLPEYDFEREMRRVTNTEKEISKQEGLTEGKESAAREIAINFMKNGVDINIVSKSTGLSIKELTDLKEKEAI